VNDVRNLCQRILDQPAPSMRDSAEVLAIARHATRRRARVTAAAGGGLVATVATIAIAAVATLPPTRPSTPEVQPFVSAPQTPATSPPEAPTREAADAHGDRTAQHLANALPAGYTGRPGFDGRATATWLPAGRPNPTADHYVSQTRIIVSNGDGEGSLSATRVGDGLPAPTGDLCAPEVATRLAAYLGDGPDTCATATINGVRIRIATARSASTATRFLNGGLLVVGWTPHWSKISSGDPSRPWREPDDSGQPPSIMKLFTATQLAELAADPQLLP
jgi:hypothetical protein